MKDGAYTDFKIFTGNSNPGLAEEVASIMGKPLGKATVSYGKRSVESTHILFNQLVILLMIR